MALSIARCCGLSMSRVSLQSIVITFLATLCCGFDLLAAPQDAKTTAEKEKAERVAMNLFTVAAADIMSTSGSDSINAESCEMRDILIPHQTSRDHLDVEMSDPRQFESMPASKSPSMGIYYVLATIFLTVPVSTMPYMTMYAQDVSLGSLNLRPIGWDGPPANESLAATLIFLPATLITMVGLILIVNVMLITPVRTLKMFSCSLNDHFKVQLENRLADVELDTDNQAANAATLTKAFDRWYDSRSKWMTDRAPFFRHTSYKMIALLPFLVIMAVYGFLTFGPLIASRGRTAGQLRIFDVILILAGFAGPLFCQFAVIYNILCLASLAKKHGDGILKLRLELAGQQGRFQKMNINNGDSTRIERYLTLLAEQVKNDYVEASPKLCGFPVTSTMAAIVPLLPVMASLVTFAIRAI